MKQFLAAVLLLLYGAVAVAKLDFDLLLSEVEQLIDSDVNQAILRVAELDSQITEMAPEQQGKFLSLKGVTQLYTGNYKGALRDFKKAALSVSNSIELASIYNYEATAYIGIRDYENALAVMSKNLALIVNVNDVATKRAAYVRVANLYYEINAVEELGIYANKALQLATSLDTRDACHAKLLIGMHSLGVKQFELAFENFESSREYCLINDFPLLAYMSIKGKGFALQLRSDFVNARPFLLDALDGYQKFKFQIEISHVHALLAQNYQALGQNNDAEQHAEYVIAQADDPSYSKHKQIAYQVLSELAAKQGRFEQAYGYSLQAQHYKQLLLDETKIKALAYQASKFNSDEQAREIRLLNKERELYLAQQSVKERERTNMLMFVTILLGGVCFLGILAMVGMLQKRKYMRLAKIDGLTGIYNRGAGQDLAEDIFIQVLARGGDFSLVLFDLDHFKQINDRLGHATGDWALKKVVEVLKSLIRSGDIFARIGGEEFAIMLPYADEARALALAQQCRETIAAIDTHFSGHSFQLSASFGVSSLEEPDLSLDPLFHRADVALYAAKNAGRNQVLAYVAEMGEQASQASAIPAPVVS